MDVKAIRDRVCSIPKKCNDFVTINKPVILQQELKHLKYGIPEEMKQISVLLKEEAGRTTYNQGFNLTCNDNDTSQRVPNLSLRPADYIKQFDEKKLLLPDMPKKPPFPLKVTLSEYKDKYSNVAEIITIMKNNELFSKRSSKIANLYKKQQLKITNESDGFLKYLDPYISTTHLHHHFHTLRTLKKYENKPYQSKEGLNARTKQIYDERVFKTKFYERILPKFTRAVPHSGMESEMKGSYRTRSDELAFYKCKAPLISMPPVTSGIEEGKLSTPMLYQTEYSCLERDKHIHKEI